MSEVLLEAYSHHYDDKTGKYLSSSLGVETAPSIFEVHGVAYSKEEASEWSAAGDMHDAIKAALCDDPDWRRLCVDALAKAEGRLG